MPDLQATGPNPGTEYLPGPGLPIPPYHEDRQVTLAGGPGAQMYRTFNAQFDELLGTWNRVSAAPAYSMVQNPDGSIHYYMLNSSGLWSGSGNNAVYNAQDYGLVEGVGQSAATRAANVAAIQNAVDAAIAKIVPGKSNGGGTVVIPAGIYELAGTAELSATVMIANVTGGLVIRGESAGTTLIQYGTTEGTVNIAADIFDVSNASNPAQFGVRFRDLTLQYASGLTVPSGGACAINCLGGTAYISAEECAFVNCPQAFATGSQNDAGLHSGLMNCTVYQDESGYSNSTQVMLGAPEAFVINTNILQHTYTAPTGCVGIAVQGQAEGCRIYGCHISYPSTGIWVRDGAVFTYITDCEVDCASGLTIATQSDSAMIYGTYVTACKFGLSLKYAPPSPTSGIFIDTAGGANTNVEGTFIVNCLAYGYENAGLQINQGQSISVTGGKYSSNGRNPTSPALGAGIAITGPCADIRIVGVDCSGVFDFLVPPPQQPYGISVANGVTGVIVSSCNLTGSAPYLPLHVPTSGTDLRVNDCAGYNDQLTLLNGEVAPESEVSASSCTTPYYGPSVVTFSNPSTLEVYASGVTNFMSFGSLYLSHASDLISFSGQPSSSFAWIGK